MSSPFDTAAPWQKNSYQLERRIVKGISKLGYVYPTLVQAQTIPLALQGKDVLVRSRTGSGKTLAFSIPCIQKILQEKQQGSQAAAGVQCVILAPTVELVKQIAKSITDLLYYLRDDISLCAITSEKVSPSDFKLRAVPDIVLATPTKLLAAVQSGALSLSGVRTLVLDEADLILSYGYKDDLHKITSRMPKIFQGILVSATLSAELDKFKRLLLHKPVVLKLEEAQSMANLMQFYLPTSEEDKFLTLYVFLKLGILQGKGLIFVNDVNKCYKVKLFLQQFFVSAAVLNAEIPVNSRAHILEEFNRGLFDYLIATDASVDTGEDDTDDSDDDDDDDDEANGGDESDGEDDASKQSSEEGSHDEDDDEKSAASDSAAQSRGASSQPKNTSQPTKKAARKNNKVKAQDEDDEYGVSRGIDFQGVSFVVNFDFPVTAAAYIHRIGRTARGMTAAGNTNSGLALSFVRTDGDTAYSEHELLSDIQNRQPRMGVLENDHVLASLHNTADRTGQQADHGSMQPAMLAFNREELESFRYRVQDVYRSITKVAIKELRAAELRRELLHSEKLHTYFQENPEDLKVLRHDKAVLHPIRQKDHLKFVPDYLIPQSMKTLTVQTKGKNNKSNRRKALKRQADKATGASNKSKDPLFNASALDDQSEDDNDDGEDDVDDDDDMGDDDEDDEDDDGEEGESGQSRRGGREDKLRNTMSGRKRWKMHHQKGEFNPRNKKKKSNITPGTFLTSRKYKK